MMQCYICGKPAVTTWNLSMHMASSIPDNMQPVCDDHNPLKMVIVSASVPSELATLRTWKAAAEPLLRVFVAMHPKVLHLRGTPLEIKTCEFCHVFDLATDPESHAADCPVTLARALLAESEGNK